MPVEPKQYLFVTNRDVIVTSIQGYSIEFLKGVPTHVPRSMHEEVMEKGAVACDDKGEVLALDKQPERVEPKVFVAPEAQEERDDKILEVMRELVKRNNSADFSAGGVPTSAAVSASLHWHADQNEVSKVWRKNKVDLLKDA